MATGKLVGQVTCYWEVSTTVDAICEDCPSCYNDFGGDIELEFEPWNWGDDINLN